MNDKDLSDDELEEELEQALKANETKRDNCGTPIPTNREVGVQRTDVKIKKKE
jgi:hypothetical protein